MDRLQGITVVVVNNFPGPGLGGGEVQLKYVCEALLAEGAKLHAALVPSSDLTSWFEEHDTPVTLVPMSLATTYRAAARIAAAASGRDRVVVLGTGFFTNVLARIAARRLPGAVCVNIVAVTPGASVAQGGSKADLLLRKMLDRLTAARVDAFVAVAQSVADGLAAWGTPGNKIRVIRNAVDIGALVSAANGALPAGIPQGDGPLVACAARLEPVKGVSYLVDAARDLHGVRFAVAGTGAEEDALRQKVDSEGIGDRFAFLGGLHGVASLLAAADVVTVPSLSEGLPMVVLEAMSLGKPVVASRVGGIPEAVIDGETGVLVEPSDSSALAAALHELLGDTDRRERMGRAAALRAQEGFSLERMSNEYVELIAELSSKRASA